MAVNSDNMGMNSCFVSLQEHFFMKRNLSKIANLLPSDFVVYSIAAFKDCDQVRRGRGKGGLVSRIPIKNSNRVRELNSS